MASRATWSDWWASRTMKLNAFLLALWSATLPVIIMWDEADWQEFGLSRSAAMLIVAALNIISSTYNLYLRSSTTRPLAGRANAGDES